jgi:hypothetical protein
VEKGSRSNSGTRPRDSARRQGGIQSRDRVRELGITGSVSERDSKELRRESVVGGKDSWEESEVKSARRPVGRRNSDCQSLCFQSWSRLVRLGVGKR